MRIPREAGFALRYVLLNARKHGRVGSGRVHEGGLGVPWGWVDGCSSAAWFRDFVRPDALTFGARQCRELFTRRHPSLDAPVVAPETWLLRCGYQRAGPFDVDDEPA